MHLRPYQQTALDHVYSAWGGGARNVVLQMPTGAGKTVVISNALLNNSGQSIAIAHRAELVSQLSLTLGHHGVRHDLIAAKQVIKNIAFLHMQQFGRLYYQPGAAVTVSGIDTLLGTTDSRFSQMTLVVQDEGHHVLNSNKWGRAMELFPRARGLFPTATPLRADGKGLGRHADGLADSLVIGPTMRELIDMGHLTDYRIFAPASDIDLSSVTLTASGDFSPPKLRDAVHKSHIVGDVVAHYLRFAAGKLGVTFATDIDGACEIAQAYRNAGVTAEVISGKTSDILRASLMQKFRNREIMQLVNVDLLGEGVDVPAIEVVSFARPTQSFAVYAQQFGRALRPMPGKEHALIIDHVGNVMRHGLPDSPRVWSLDRRERRSRETPQDVIPMRTCANPTCVGVFERTHSVCPYCGHKPVPAQRSGPEHVDGDLTELDPGVLAKLRGEIARIDGVAHPPQNLDPIAQRAVIKRHLERQREQKTLRDAIALWAGYARDQGQDDSEIYKRFYFKFGIDVMSAQALNASDARDLADRINAQLSTLGVTPAERLEGEPEQPSDLSTYRPEDIVAANALINRLVRYDVPLPFTAHAIWPKGWVGVPQNEYRKALDTVKVAIAILVDTGFLQEEKVFHSSHPAYRLASPLPNSDVIKIRPKVGSECGNKLLDWLLEKRISSPFTRNDLRKRWQTTDPPKIDEAIELLLKRKYLRIEKIPPRIGGHTMTVYHFINQPEKTNA